ncbi:MAG: hypothetical protein KGJ62_14530 [Armatimonadetes bacterium]|nr:hypothetical protein [Armatimonadota bacterium]
MRLQISSQTLVGFPQPQDSDPVAFDGQFGCYTDWLVTGQAGPTRNGPILQSPFPALILCGLRYYDPANGIWLTRDPTLWDGGINLYEYCGDDPVNAFDPLGLGPRWTIWGFEFTPHVILEGIKTGLAATAHALSFGHYTNRHYAHQSGYGGSVVLATIGREAALWALQDKAFEAAGAAINAARAARAERLAEAGLTGMERVRWLGQVGEAAAGIVKNTERIIPPRGGYRIPDELDRIASVIGEVKNVKSLSYTKQLQDYYAWAAANKYALRLYIRAGKGTVLSPALQAMERAGEIVVRRVIP